MIFSNAVYLSVETSDAPHIARLADTFMTRNVFPDLFLHIDLLSKKAAGVMDWFQPAWDQLTEEERYVLETFYGDVNSYGSNAVYYIASYFKIEQSSAYKRKNRALDRLTVLLFGKA